MCWFDRRRIGGPAMELRYGGDFQLARPNGHEAGGCLLYRRRPEIRQGDGVAVCHDSSWPIWSAYAAREQVLSADGLVHSLADGGDGFTGRRRLRGTGSTCRGGNGSGVPERFARK